MSTRHGALSVQRPGLVIGTITAVCLAAFLASIPLPRVDGQLLGGDGFGYYVYLPSLVLDHDLDFTNQMEALQADGGRPPKGRTATGVVGNPWPAGPALLWLPFFLLAHATALALNALGAGIRTDGCGYWHQAFVLAGNIVYGGLGIGLAFGVARRVATTSAALWSTVLMVCAGNLVYYLTGEPSMSHPVSVFAVSAFFWYWIRTRHQSGVRRAAVLGALTGLVAIVRTQEVLLLIVPLAEDWWGAKRRGAAWLTAARAREALAMDVVALLVYTPQLFVSHAVYGTWWKPPQLHAGWGPDVPLFTWWSPHFVDVLLSPDRGLFTWHPVYALALAGAVPLWRRDRWLAAAVAAAVAGQAYLVGAWYDWTQGQSFGGRGFIGCLPLLAASLATLWDVAAAKRPGRMLARSAAALAALLVAANLLLMIEYRLVLSRTNRPVTWHDLGAGRITVPFGLE